MKSKKRPSLKKLIYRMKIYGLWRGGDNPNQANNLGMILICSTLSAAHKVDTSSRYDLKKKNYCNTYMPTD